MPPQPETSGRSPSRLDRVFVALSHGRRRSVLRLLDDGEVDTVDDLLPRSSGDPRDVKVELVHDHLPRLADAGYVDWDPDEGTISKGPRFEEVRLILEAVDRHADGFRDGEEGP